MNTNSVYFEDIRYNDLLKDFNFYEITSEKYSKLKNSLDKNKVRFHYYFFQTKDGNNKAIIVTKDDVSFKGLTKVSLIKIKSGVFLLPHWVIVSLVLKEELFQIESGGLNRFQKLIKESISKNDNHTLSFHCLKIYTKKSKGARGSYRVSLNITLKDTYIKKDESEKTKKDIFDSMITSGDDCFLFDLEIKGLNDSSYTSFGKNEFLEYGNRLDFYQSKSKFLSDVLKCVKHSKYFKTVEFVPETILKEKLMSNHKMFKDNHLLDFINKEGISLIISDHLKNELISKRDLDDFKNICLDCGLKFVGYFRSLDEVSGSNDTIAINITKKREKIGKNKEERANFDAVDRYIESDRLVQNITVDKFMDIVEGIGGGDAVLYKVLSELYLKHEVINKNINSRRKVPDHSLFFLKKRNKKDLYFDMYGVILNSGELNFIKNEKISSPFGIEKYNHSFIEIDNKKYLIERSRIRNIIPNEPLLEQYDLLDNPHPSFLKIKKEVNSLLKKGLDDSLIDIKELDKLCKTKIKDIKTTFKDGDLRKRYNSIIDELNNNYGCDIEKIKRFNPEKSKNTVPNTTRLNAFIDQGDFYYKTSHFSLKDYKIPTNAEYISVINGAEIKDKIISIIESAIYNYTYNKEGKIVDSTNNFSDLLKYLNEYFFKRDENKLRI